MGLFAEPRATAVGWGELFTTEAAMGWARLTATGAGGATTFFGGAGAITGAGWVIFTSAGFGTSRGFTSGSLILGGSTLTTGCGKGRGITFGTTGSIGLSSTGVVSIVTRFCSSRVRFAIVPSRSTRPIRARFNTIEVAVEALLCFPVSRTPKSLNW